MATDIELRPRVGETEKLTINLGVVDLGQIDLLVQEGFYSNRTDLIRTAIRNQLALHGDAVKSTVARRTLVLGLQSFSRADLERARAARRTLRIHVVGLARIAEDVTPELAAQPSNPSKYWARFTQVPAFATHCATAYVEPTERQTSWTTLNHSTANADSTRPRSPTPSSARSLLRASILLPVHWCTSPALSSRRCRPPGSCPARLQ